MRWHIRALGEVAQVAHIALVDHFPVVFFVNAIDLHGLALVNQIKQRWERTAQTHATAAAMADIKNPLHFMENGFFVVVIRAFPVNRVTGGRLEVAFCCHGGSQ